MRPEFGAREKNLERVCEMLRGSGADLVVVPELVTTGYQFLDREELASLAEPVPDGPSTQAFLGFCRDEGLLLCFGLAEIEGDRLYNTAVLAGPEGVLLTYRKSHLFWDEKDMFEPGDLGFPVVDLPGGAARVGILICFDYMFPEAARALALQGAEIVLHPSNLITQYGQQTMVTRSVENGVFVLTSNRVGTEARGGKDPLTFGGESQIVAPRGEVLATLSKTEEGLCVAEVDPATARDKLVTPRNDVLEDRRPELYGLLLDGPGDDR
ncbi:MAG: nitrilase-related carbon-nitrogen hydrolase [Planctomycetota bacterium]